MAAWLTSSLLLLHHLLPALRHTGVLVVLTDNTIGHVLRVLDAPNLAATPAAPATTTASSRPHKHKPAAAAAAAAAAGYQPGAELGVAGDAILDQFTFGGSLLVTQGGLADAWAADGELSAAGAGSGEDVAALFQRFSGLQQRFGEAMCEGVLEACGFDFQAACQELEGQQQLLEGGAASSTPTSSSAAAAAAAGGGGMSSWEQPISDNSWHGGSPPPAEPSPLAAAAAAIVVPVPVAVPAVSLRQLAEEAGVAREAAEQLAGMLGEVEPSQVVAALVAKGGDVNAAAEALLSGEPLEQPAAQQAVSGEGAWGGWRVPCACFGATCGTHQLQYLFFRLSQRHGSCTLCLSASWPASILQLHYSRG
jgi:hypothetical protein